MSIFKKKSFIDKISDSFFDILFKIDNSIKEKISTLPPSIAIFSKIILTIVKYSLALIIGTFYVSFIIISLISGIVVIFFIYKFSEIATTMIVGATCLTLIINEWYKTKFKLDKNYVTKIDRIVEENINEWKYYIILIMTLIYLTKLYQYFFN